MLYRLIPARTSIFCYDVRGAQLQVEVVECILRQVELKIINFWLRQCILLVPTCALTKRNFEKLLLEATKSALEHLGSHFDGNRTVCLIADILRSLY